MVFALLSNCCRGHPSYPLGRLRLLREEDQDDESVDLKTFRIILHSFDTPRLLSQGHAPFPKYQNNTRTQPERPSQKVHPSHHHCPTSVQSLTTSATISTRRMASIIRNSGPRSRKFSSSMCHHFNTYGQRQETFL